ASDMSSRTFEMSSVQSICGLVHPICRPCSPYVVAYIQYVVAYIPDVVRATHMRRRAGHMDRRAVQMPSVQARKWSSAVDVLSRADWKSCVTNGRRHCGDTSSGR